MITTERCKKSDTNSTGGNPSLYTMTATVNNTSYKGTGCQAIINGTELTISEESRQPFLFLIVNGYNGPGTYQIDTPTVAYPVPNQAIFDSSSISSPANAYTGTINIISASATVISGTFNFMATSTYLDTVDQVDDYVTDTISISNGNFTAQLLP
jgi:hypothetical protein